MARKDVYESELKRLTLIAFRLEGEQRVRQQAEKSRQEAVAAAIVAKRKERESAQMAAAANNPYSYVTPYATRRKRRFGWERQGRRLLAIHRQSMPPSFSDWGGVVAKSSMDRGAQITPSVSAAIDPDQSNINSFSSSRAARCCHPNVRRSRRMRIPPCPLLLWIGRVATPRPQPPHLHPVFAPVRAMAR